MARVYHSPIIPASKPCSKCGKEKKAGEFYKDGQQKSGLRPSCIQCDKESRADYELARREQKAAHQRIYNKEHHEQLKPYKRTWQKEHYDADRRYQGYLRRQDKAREEGAMWQERNKEGRNQKRRERYQENPNQEKQRVRKRQSLCKGVSVATVDYDAILARDGYICHLCGGEIAPKDLQYDHVIPLARGGPHSPENIKVAHAVCNARKGKFLMEELTPFHKRGVKSGACDDCPHKAE